MSSALAVVATHTHMTTAKGETCTFRSRRNVSTKRSGWNWYIRNLCCLNVTHSEMSLALAMESREAVYNKAIQSYQK